MARSMPRHYNSFHIGSDDAMSVSTTGWLIVLVMREPAIYTVASATDALHLLSSDWPVQDSLAFLEAMEACQGVGNGNVTNEAAQYAFLAAAMDAGIAFEFP